MLLLHRLGVLALLGLAASIVLLPVDRSEAVSHPFTDITRSWQIEPVDWLWTEGITTGVTPTSFAPERGVTRGEMATFLWRAAGSPDDNPSHPFTDVVADWQEEAVRWLSTTGITTGVSPTSFAPNRLVTRGEMAAFLWRAEGEPAENRNHPFVDVSLDWQRESVRWLYNAGITSGVSDILFAPKRTVTRGEMATFLHRRGVVETRLTNPPVPDPPPSSEPLSLLVFTETQGFRHSVIDDGSDALETMAADEGWKIEFTNDSDPFLDDDLADVDTVVFLHTTGDFFNSDEEAAFQDYIRAGGGYVGIHAAADAEYDWDWYGELMGAWFDRHPATQSATIIVEDNAHPSTAHLGSTWTRTDEWFDFRRNPRSDVNVLLSLDEDTYSGGGMGGDHPIAWYHEFDGGRSWYTGLGHTDDTYEEPAFLQHLKGGIEWTAGRS